MPRRSYAGGATPTTLTSPIDGVVLTATIADSSGWPSGLSGPFTVVFDRGQAGEEKVLCSQLTGSTLTISTRGYDGTAASAHGASATAEVSLSAIEVDEVNAHAFDTGLDQHTQYLNTARHGAIEHDTAQIADGAITQPKLAKPAVGTPELIDGAVDSAKLGVDSVGSAHIIDGSVATQDLKDLNVTTAKIALDAIDSTLIADNAVGTEHIQDGKVTEAKLEATQRNFVVADYTALDAISPVEGAQGWTQDTNRAWAYNGSVWQLIGGKIPFVDATRSANGAISHSTWTPITFATSSPVDADGFVDGPLYAVPAGLGGRYLCEAGVTWVNDNEDMRSLRFVTNTTTYTPQSQIAWQSNVVTMAHSISRTIILDAADTVAFEVWQNTGSNLTMDNAFFNITYLGSSV